ncbi:hypothetical protein ERJ75_000300000 [Trypanosoma vivax]|nr:hypothetical protein ERJ75_000300000 [Trypanosoma vivax]
MQTATNARVAKANSGSAATLRAGSTTAWCVARCARTAVTKGTRERQDGNGQAEKYALELAPLEYMKAKTRGDSRERQCAWFGVRGNARDRAGTTQEAARAMARGARRAIGKGVRGADCGAWTCVDRLGTKGARDVEATAHCTSCGRDAPRERGRFGWQWCEPTRHRTRTQPQGKGAGKRTAVGGKVREAGKRREKPTRDGWLGARRMSFGRHRRRREAFSEAGHAQQECRENRRARQEGWRQQERGGGARGRGGEPAATEESYWAGQAAMHLAQRARGRQG